MAFGALIRKHRRLKGLTLKQISAPLGVSVAYWCRIEQDTGTPPRDALIVQAAAILGVPEDEAFVAAGRLPLDMRSDIRRAVAIYRAAHAEARSAA